MFFDEIDNIELDDTALSVGELEVKPLVVAFGVGVILDNEVVLLN
jgi:hypothetical protein